MSKKSVIKRTVYQAIEHAERLKKDLPKVVQVYPREWDLVVLAEYIKQLEKGNCNLCRDFFLELPFENIIRKK